MSCALKIILSQLDLPDRQFFLSELQKLGNGDSDRHRSMPIKQFVQSRNGANNKIEDATYYFELPSVFDYIIHKPKSDSNLFKILARERDECDIERPTKKKSTGDKVRQTLHVDEPVRVFTRAEASSSRYHFRSVVTLQTRADADANLPSYPPGREVKIYDKWSSDVN
jgi:hypothetical protein